MHSRHACLVLCVGFAGALTAVSAQEYPYKPIRILVAFPPGGPTDIVARTLAQKITDHWGYQVVVDNRAGGNGIVGQEVAARATPDGHTILVQSVAFAVNPSLYKLPYDTHKDFIPVKLVVSTSLMLVVNPALTAKSVKELIALAKSKPRQLNFSSPGIGSSNHLAGELLNIMTGIEMVHVAYKGVPQAMTDVMSGQMQLMLPGIPPALPHTKTGRLRGLAVTSKQRSPLAPEMPTMIEAGVPGYDWSSWFGVFLPGGTPRPVVNKLHDEVVRILNLPEVRNQFDAQGFDPLDLTPSSPADFSRIIKADMERYAKIIKQVGVKVE